MNYTKLKQCLACGGSDLHPYLSLGEQPLANNFHDGGEPTSTFPLEVCVCRDCYHSQLSISVDPALLFTNYAYVSGTTQTLRDYFKWFVDKVEGDFGAERKLRILEIGCNDATLLEMFRERGHDVQGVDPAGLSDANPSVPVIKTFWGRMACETVERLWSPNFDAIIAMNVLAHVDNPTGFLALAKRVLAPDGRIYVQTSQAKMLLNGEFDTIYHEHVSYFTARSFKALADRVGLSLISEIQHVPIHGTSYLVELGHGPESVFDRMAVSEDRMGYYTPAIYDRFRELAEHTRDQTRKMVASCRSMGYRIVGYGAAAKGMTFLNYTGIEIDFIVDDNPLKRGKYTPGSNISVLGMDASDAFVVGAGSDVKYLWVILAWNFREEIIERIKARRPNGRDLFLTYFPRMVCSG